ncbi:MAG: Nramp family divalent metal transporter [Planctomycetaceae bacterium]
MTDRTGPDTGAFLPPSRLPPWGVEDLPEPVPLASRGWGSFVGPGIVMCGIALAGGEWLVGADITARYGGGLMWIATLAIVAQVFYNIECGRYALYCGEPIFTGFMRLWPGPAPWVGLIFVLSIGAFVPAMSTNAAAVAVAAWLGRPPLAADAWMVKGVAYVLLALVTLPILVGGKVYSSLQVIFTVKVVVVLGFCLAMGLAFVDRAQWWLIYSGFFRFGSVPTTDAAGAERVVNVFGHWLSTGAWPDLRLENVALIGAFAGYAGGGGLSNSTYSNYVRDKGWGMGSRVGAIPSLVGGRTITLSHLGKVFPATPANLRRWRAWWNYVLADQLLVWMPGCFMGMALPGLISMKFSRFSTLYEHKRDLDWAQALISADGIRRGIADPTLAQVLWLVTLLVGMVVLVPSQLAVVEEFARKWTDLAWSGLSRIRSGARPGAIRRLYYGILAVYVVWTTACAWLFNTYGSPKLMATFIANFNNVALGLTAFAVLAVNRRFLPPVLRPGRLATVGMWGCGVFYLGLAALVFRVTNWPVLHAWWVGR